MTRTNAREIAAQLIYEMNFHDADEAQSVVQTHLEPDYFETLRTEDGIYEESVGAKQLAYISDTVRGVWARRDELDGYIAKYAIGWNVSRISKMARAIMQLAMYECLYVHDVPVGAAINEAVELTRKYEEEDVVSFVNGILGAFAREAQGE